MRRAVDLMPKPLSELQGVVRRRALFGALITSPVDIQYLLDLDRSVSDAWLWVGRRRCWYLTDGRYTAEWRPLAAARGVGLMDQGPLKALKRLLGTISRRVGFEPGDVTHSLYLDLKKTLPPASRLIPLNGWVKRRRMIKSSDELDKVGAALKLHEALLQHLSRWLRPGLSETRVAWEIERFIRINGAQPAFDPIAASGPNSAFPHARPTSRKILADDTLLVDCGVSHQGYRSDLTRHFVFGKINRFYIKIYKEVQTAQKKAVEAMKPGVPAASVDRSARGHLKRVGLERYFCHSLGHGVGLEIHEAPRLSFHDKTILEPGMLVTVEPGVYLENKFGVRVEDMVFITPEGASLISRPEIQPVHIQRT